VHLVVPKILQLFSAYGIHATWAVVGLIACTNREEALACIPHVKPAYTRAELSPYTYLCGLDFVNNEQIHFAPSLIRQVADTDNQEVATHTFSHYYCLEEGQPLDAFYYDLNAALELFQRKYGIRPRSIVFPRNQYSQEHIKVCEKHGIIAYRGSSPGWLNMPRNQAQENLVIRLLRLADSYFNISGYHSSPYGSGQASAPVNIPASRFLRPCARNTMIRRLQVRRIKAEMHNAARSKSVYHLWWHPHNFGVEIEKNLDMLNEILKYFSQLRSTFGMKSMNMEEYAYTVLKEQAHGGQQ
jgi:peptidoglycan/xylan/chitin deacetylase (PgdA/CDA1 family)